MVRVMCCVAVVLIAGCQSAGPGGPAPADRPVTERPTQPAKAPGASTPATGTAAQPRAGWRPGWWLEKPKRTGAGAVQASGTATAGELLEARRQAIESARTSAMTLADAGQAERVVQAATNPNANGSYTVWVVLEVGGQ